MPLHPRTLFRTLDVMLALMLASCTDRSQSDDSTGTTGTSAPPGHTPCSRVHEGTLYIGEATDIESLNNIGVVEGGLRIDLRERDQRDLSFLQCLHTVDGNLMISSNDFLESLQGIENLRSATRIYIHSNPSLRTVHLPALAEVEQLEIMRNPMLEEISFDSLTTAAHIGIGTCYRTEPGGADLLSLVDLSGFGALTSAGSVWIQGNEALLSVGIFDALAANGAPDPLGEAYVEFNPLLPETEVQAQLDVLGPERRYVCGNLDGDPQCFCHY